jgi:ankyrin repeat protein
MKKKVIYCLVTIICVCNFNCFAGPNEDLFTACKAGKLEDVKKAVAAGANVNGLDAGGNPALSSAFFWPDIVKYLLDNKADPNLGACTPLWQATFYCSVDVMKLLLDAGADPNKPFITDPSVTFKNLVATEKAKGKEANKNLIKAWEGMMESAKPTESFPLATMVTNNNCVPCMQLLIDKGAKLDKGVGDGTMIHVFAGSGASPEYRKTVFAAVKPSIEKYGYTVPDWYVNMPDDRNRSADEVLKVLIAKGLDVNQKNKSATKIPDQSALEMALGNGLGNREAVMLALIANGADVKLESKWSGPVILQAAQCGFASVVKAMVEKGADINAEGICWTDADNGAQIRNFTPLTCAAAKNHLEVVKYLLTHGADNHGISGSIVAGACPAKLSNKSAIYFAIENKNMEMVKFIVDNKGYDGKHLSISAKKMTNCIGGGSYKPSEYADELEQGDLKDYLKKSGM